MLRPRAHVWLGRTLLYGHLQSPRLEAAAGEAISMALSAMKTMTVRHKVYSNSLYQLLRSESAPRSPFPVALTALDFESREADMKTRVAEIRAGLASSKTGARASAGGLGGYGSGRTPSGGFGDGGESSVCMHRCAQEMVTYC
jgi:hypothetical protein